MQVMMNIISNAIKFTPEEGQIHVAMYEEPSEKGEDFIRIHFHIADTGIGMTDAQLTEMYNVFYQADSGSSRFAGGLGLGLPIAQGLLTAMGGFIHFDSKEQQGLSAHHCYSPGRCG